MSWRQIAWDCGPLDNSHRGAKHTAHHIHPRIHQFPTSYHYQLASPSPKAAPLKDHIPSAACGGGGGGGGAARRRQRGPVLLSSLLPAYTVNPVTCLLLSPIPTLVTALVRLCLLSSSPSPSPLRVPSLRFACSSFCPPILNIFISPVPYCPILDFSPPLFILPSTPTRHQPQAQGIPTAGQNVHGQ